MVLRYCAGLFADGTVVVPFRPLAWGASSGRGGLAFEGGLVGGQEKGGGPEVGLR